MFFHSATASLILGGAGKRQYDDAIVTRTNVLHLCDSIVAIVDDKIQEASLDAPVLCKDGRKVHLFVERTIASMENLMTRLRREGKFDRFVKSSFGDSKAESLKKLCRGMTKLENVNALVAMTKSD